MVKHGIIAVIVLMILVCRYEIAAAEESDARSVIAALSYNFAKYADWPEPALKKKTIEFCYFSDNLKNSFDALKQKKIDNKAVRIRQLSAVEQSDLCHLVFVDKSERELIQRMFVHLEAQPVLTVSDIAGFVDEGGMIEIVKTNNKFRFKVNMQQMKKAQLKMSSQVLKLALDIK